MRRSKQFTGTINAQAQLTPPPAKNPDYTLSIDRMKKWEKDHGEIPAGALVALRTDWSKR